MSTKVVCTNRSALTSKYDVGATAIMAALSNLVTRDAALGITSTIVYLDDAVQMGAYGAIAVTSASDPKQSKDAIDAVAIATAANYILLIGAPDLLPHQDLDNPLISDVPEDRDPDVPSDLPYACTAPYSTSAGDFTSPTRSVSRIPDIMGANDGGTYLLKLLTNVTSFQSRPSAFYSDYFAATADVWLTSSQLSTKNIYGNLTGLQDCPPSGPPWSAAQYNKGTHFANLHGSANEPTWYGQPGPSTSPPAIFPDAMRSAEVSAQSLDGNVCSVEACYGAQLYDPTSMGVTQPICNSYLGSGCIGFFGSTTIAYGDSSVNSAADLLTQFFLVNILNGDSIGNACLSARQQYVHANPTPSHTDLKTLAQFIALGDPSLVPVTVAAPDGLLDASVEIQLVRNNRLTVLRTAGERLRNAVPLPHQLGGGRSQSAQAVLDNAARRLQLRATKTTTYSYEMPSKFDAKAAGIDGTILHVLSGSRGPANSKIRNVTIVEVFERHDTVINVRVLMSH